MKTVELLDGIYMIDNSYNSVFIIEGSEKSAIIETAYPSEFNSIRRGFKRLNKKIENFDLIIGTHIHLDHFGAVGHFLEVNSSLQVVIHPKGVRHLIDPTRLNKSAKKALGDRYSFVGEMKPVNPQKILDINNGSKIDLGDRELQIIYTPGHAKHHIIIYDNKSKAIFTGDSLANIIPNYPIMIVTPPPDYNFEQAINSVQKIKSLNPQYLIQTHASLVSVDKNKEIFEIVLEQHKKWLQFVEKIVNKGLNPVKNEFSTIFKEENPLNFTQKEIEKCLKKYSHVPFMNYMGIRRYLMKSS
ncbi:MAG: MBL fold metallo-hydrolase [Candidatus Lokiarchaeota archaeon]|nr:MBL fold metallo-hydrolase [Candidatus Lokiarchaeota archaeon]